MSSSYPLHDDQPSSPMCQHCGMVLPRNLYCTHCGYYNDAVQTNIAAQETRPAPIVNRALREEVFQSKQSRQRPEQYNTLPQSVAPKHYAHFSVPGTPSVTPFLGIAPQPDVAQKGSAQLTNNGGLSALPYVTQPTLIIPGVLQKGNLSGAAGPKRELQRRNGNRGILLGIIIAIVVLVGGGLVGYHFLSASKVQKSVRTTTALLASQPKESLKFTDVFKDNGNQWNLQSEAGKYSVAIANGNLILEDDNNSLLPELLPGDRSFSNFKIVVDAILAKGDEKNGYGLYIRCASDQSGSPSTYYRFEIYGDSTYAIFKGVLDKHGKASPSPTKLVSYTMSSAIQKRGSSNHIEVNAQGSIMTIRVNGQVLKTFSDPSYTKGTIALFLSNIQNAPAGAQAKFSNLAIYPE